MDKPFWVSYEGCGNYAVKTQIAEESNPVAVFNGRERLCRNLCAGLNKGTCQMVVAPLIGNFRLPYRVGGTDGVRREPDGRQGR